MGNPGDRTESQKTAKSLLIFPTRKFPEQTYIKTLLKKLFLPHQIAIFINDTIQALLLFIVIAFGSGFDLTTRDSYFTILVEVFTNHISDENKYFTNNIEWTEYKIMGFKPANRYQIIRQSLLIHDFHHQPFLCQAKVM